MLLMTAQESSAAEVVDGKRMSFLVDSPIRALDIQTLLTEAIVTEMVP